MLSSNGLIDTSASRRSCCRQSDPLEVPAIVALALITALSAPSARQPSSIDVSGCSRSQYLSVPSLFRPHTCCGLVGAPAMGSHAGEAHNLVLL